MTEESPTYDANWDPWRVPMARTDTMDAATYQAKQTEAQFQTAVMELADYFGWVPIHFRQMVGNPSGYPDLTIIRGDRVILAELKSERGTVSRRQREWIDRMASVGTVVHVWRPSDWDAIEASLRGEP